MKIQASNAIENGFTAQLTKRVTPKPRQCWRIEPSDLKSTRISIGTIISQIRTPTGAESVKDLRHEATRSDASDDTQGDPQAEPAFECA
jgi:hypothetical protein